MFSTNGHASADHARFIGRLVRKRDGRLAPFDRSRIAHAVEMAFNVHVVDVNTSHVPGKLKRYGRNVGHQASWKKAIVTLVPGDKIELFEGI